MAEEKDPDWNVIVDAAHKNEREAGKRQKDGSFMWPNQLIR